MTEIKEDKALVRLKALEEYHSGFDLAEVDLKMRGPGEILGTAQHGFGKLKIASWSDFDIIALSREIATQIVENQPKFAKLLDGLEKPRHN